MKRWLSAAALGAVVALTISVSTAAWADRTIPPEAKRVKVSPADSTGHIQINGNVTPLSPAAVITSDSNRTITHGHVPEGAPAKVLFDANGTVRRVWILTADEAARRN